jgi:hypothetical protein
MRNLQFTGKLHNKNVTLVRISKAAARKHYDAGEQILLCPCNLVPLSSWNTGFIVKQYSKHPTDFETYVNKFTFYNCNNETGYYLTFYKIINH